MPDAANTSKISSHLCPVHTPPRFDPFENVYLAENIGKGATQLNSFVIGSLYSITLVQVTSKSGCYVGPVPPRSSVSQAGAPIKISLCYATHKYLHHHVLV